MNKYIMGIDNGSQSTKVAIFDLTGSEIAFGSHPLKETLTPKPGVVIHPDEDLWESVQAAIKACLKNFNFDVSDIIGIGLCTIRFCRVLLKKDGTLAASIISWMDERMNKPYHHEDDEVAFVTSTTGYLSHRLTGSFTDAAANLEAGWPMDLQDLTWAKDDMTFQAHGLTKEMVFDIVKPGEALGTLRKELAAYFGLPEDIPVIATANDKAVEVLGSGVNDQTRVMISLGTFISAMLYREKPYEGQTPPKSFWSTLACVPHKYVYESNGIRRGMWTVSWLKGILGTDVTLIAEELGMSVENYLNKQAERVPAGSEGLITILDWLATPTEPYRKGMMIGFDQRHTKFHMYRSIIEAIAFTIKNNVCDMVNEVGVNLKEVVVIGGGSKSDLLMQILADCFNLPVIRRVGSSSGALGAAMCVAVYAGVYNSFDEAGLNMVRTERIFEPDINSHQLYEQINNEVIKHVRVHTDEVLKRSYPIFK